MAVERVIIEIVGDTKQINSTITQLEKLGKVDKANAEAFAKFNKKFVDGVNNSNNALGGLDKTLDGLKNQIIGAFAIGSLVAFGKEAIQTSAKIDSITKSLEFITGGSKQAAATMEYLKNLSNRLGLEFQSTAASFKLFAGATTQSGMSLNQTKTIFESVAKAATTMGLSADDANGVFLALSQIMSKGKVSAEELRGQIGERLPGAFAIAAKSIGVTEQQLNKMLEQGQVISKDFLPKFAKQLEQDMGGGAERAANSTQAALNRLSNSWTDFKDWFGVNVVAPVVNGAADIIKAMNNASPEGKAKNEAIKQSEQIYKNYIKTIEDLDFVESKYLKTLDLISKAEKEQKNAAKDAADARVTLQAKVDSYYLSFQKGNLMKVFTEKGEKAYLDALFISGDKRIKSLVQQVRYNDKLAESMGEVAIKLEDYGKNLTSTDSKIEANAAATKKQLSAYERLVASASDLEKAFRDTLAADQVVDPKTIQKLNDVRLQIQQIETALNNINRLDLKDLSGVKPSTQAVGEAASKQPSGDFGVAAYQKEVDELQKLSDDALVDYWNTEKAKTKILEEEAAKRLQIEKEKEEAKKTIAMATIQATFQLIDMAMQYANNAAQQQINYELRLNEENFQKKKINEIAYEKNRSAILNRQNELQKQQAIAMAIINTAQAVVNALATGGAAAPALAIIAGIMGAAQIATIIATPLPKYAEGTDFVKLGKNKKGVDTVHAMLNEGEAVIKTNENAKHPGMAKAWNDGNIESYITKRFLLPNMEAKPMRGLESNLFAENVAKSIRLNQDMFGVESGLSRLNRTEIESTNIIVEAIKQSKRQNIW